MTLYVRNATLAVYDPAVEIDASSATPKLTITRSDGDLLSADISQRLANWKDDAQFTIDNSRGRYSSEISSGDIVLFAVEYDDDTAQRGGYGGTSYGEAAYGGISTALERRWLGQIRGPLSYAGSGADQMEIDIDASDLVSGVLSDRIVYDNYEERPIATPGMIEDTEINPDRGIVNSVLQTHAPELNRTGVDPIEHQIDKFSDGINLLELLADLSAEGDAVMSGVGDTVIFTPQADIEPLFELTWADLGTGELRVVDDDLHNDIRVDGGVAPALDDEQPTVEESVVLTEDNQVRHRISTRKSRLDRIELWTMRNPASQDQILVRLQKDDGTGERPIDPFNEESDIARHQLPHYFLSVNDFTTFLIPEHTLPEPNPWVIIEGTGGGRQLDDDEENGEIDGSTENSPSTEFDDDEPQYHSIGVRTSDGVPAYRAFHLYPIAVRVSDDESIRHFGRRQMRIKRDNITTMNAARTIAEAQLRHSRLPEREVIGDAHSLRAHELVPGEGVTVEFPRLTATGEFVVTERSDQFAGNQLTTELSLQEVSTL